MSKERYRILKPKLNPAVRVSRIYFGVVYIGFNWIVHEVKGGWTYFFLVARPSQGPQMFRGLGLRVLGSRGLGFREVQPCNNLYSRIYGFHMMNCYCDLGKHPPITGPKSLWKLTRQPSLDHRAHQPGASSGSCMCFGACGVHPLRMS